MDKNGFPFETLKQILRHVRQPDELNDHPWTQSLFVRQVIANTPQLAQVSPGQQLIAALASLFPELQPAAPPRCGKRLDPRWGEFGLLAALYFTPFNHGTSYPTSLLDAWGRIDPAILYFVYGKSVGNLGEEQIQRYQLVGSDLEYGSPSTLSDWHRKGLQRFAEIILNRERFLARTSLNPSIILESGPQGTEIRNGSQSLGISKVRDQKRSPARTRAIWFSVFFLLLIVLGLGSFKAWKIYQSGMLLYQDINHLQEMMQTSNEIAAVEAAAPQLQTLQGHLSIFKEEAALVIWLSPRLAWIPVYGNDLAAAPALIKMADHLLNASLLSIQAAQPFLDEFDSQDSAHDLTSLTSLLLQMEPQLRVARQELDDALAAREGIEAERLSPHLRMVLEGEVDPVLKLADQGLSLAMTLPTVLGASGNGPKTYMLLLQNEDELRPTGGFITSVGNLVLHNGKIISLQFESVDNDVQEDWSKPYPAAPWQLQEYMDSPVLILRDANWFSDFPTTTLWVEYLYAYTHSHSVDGIIAFDQQFLVMLLGTLEPLNVGETSYPLTSENVIEYMRQAKAPPIGEEIPAGWDRKEFISEIANAILMELNSGNAQDWGEIAQVVSQALAQRHLLLQFDDPVLAALIAERGWDNAIRPEEGDFLMVTDTNIGSNKTNAAVEMRLTYDVDLSDLSSPVGTLTLHHKNNSRQKVPCHWGEQMPGLEDEWYPIDRCYWTYTRVYKQAGVELIDATPHAIPDDWMILGKSVPAGVDELDDEDLPGVQGFGTLLVVPGGNSLSTSFKFALPQTVLSTDTSSNLVFRLKVQKQPGTLANPMTIRIHFPRHAILRSTFMNGIVQDDHLLIEADLRTDIELEVVFTDS